MQDPHEPPTQIGIRYWLTGEGLPRDGLTEGKACRTSMRLLRGAPTHSLNSALPSGLARCRKRAASSSLLADAARAVKQDLCAGAQRSAYLAKAVRRLTGPVQNMFFSYLCAEQGSRTCVLAPKGLHSLSKCRSTAWEDTQTLIDHFSLSTTYARQLLQSGMCRS